MMRSVRRYAVALLVTAAVLGLQVGLRSYVGDRAPFLFVIASLTYVTITLGTGPAALLLVAGGVYAALQFAPVGQLAVERPDDVVALAAYLCAGGAIIAFGSRLRATSTRARQTEQRLALLEDGSGVGFFELDFDTATAFASAGLCRMLGKPPMLRPTPLATWLESLSAGTVRESMSRLEQQVALGNLQYEREQRIERSDGVVVWFLTRVRIELNPYGVLGRVRGASIDITERKRTDELLRVAQAELQHQLMLQRALLVISETQHDDSRSPAQRLGQLLALIVEFCAGIDGILVLRSADGTSYCRGVSVADPPGDGSAAGAAIAATLAASRRRNDNRAAWQRTIDEHDRQARSAGNRVMTWPMELGDGDIPGGFVVVLPGTADLPSDASRLVEAAVGASAALLQAEASRVASERAERRFAVALQSSTVPFTILTPVRDADGGLIDLRYGFANRAAASIMGSDGATVLGRLVTDFLPGAWADPAHLEHYVHVFDRGEPREFEISFPTDDGVRWFHAIVSPLHGAAAVWFSDVTDRRQVEREMREASNKKDIFLATLAHELRNPLAPIRQGVMLAKAYSADHPGWKPNLDMMERQILHMTHLIDDLLDISRISRNAIMLRRRRVALSEVVGSAVEASRPAIDAKGQTLDIELADGDPVIDVDPVRIAQVLANILNNASKYTDAGGRIALRAAHAEGGLVLRVTDNGIGIAASEIEHLFEMFAQSQAAIDRSQGGLGVGLALSRGLVALHGGSIDASSGGIGCGSEFTIRLPDSVVADDATRTAVPAAVSGVHRQRSAAMRLVLADDNEDSADSLAEILRIHGHDVHVGYDGSTALALYERLLPDAVVLDVGMRGMSGLEVARAIRQVQGTHRPVLVALTGWGHQGDRMNALEAGFDHHITKPLLEPSQLLSVLPMSRADGDM